MRGVGFWAEGGSGPSGRRGELGRGGKNKEERAGLLAGLGWFRVSYFLLPFLFQSHSNKLNSNEI